ncbi:hypothetical protein [Chitinophaga vietnamensis]|uniref:hypothetical protein n=1 Tax=Chitinophaga vietnamensis TaxID=2593957 RepID=UPI00117862F4|nr:hypothetical protein [Chitinophaga vietnamensis]
MEDIELLDLWRSYSQRLDASLSLNKKNAADITHMKIQSLLRSMTPLKIFAIIAGLLWAGFLDVLVIRLFHAASPFFLVSMIIISLFNKLAIGIYGYQVILIRQVDITEPVFATQEKLARLRSSTFWITRILFLQMPFWTTFYWNGNMFDGSSPMRCALSVAITLAFTALAIWLFIHIRYENREEKWFRFIFRGTEWTPVLKSMELLEEMKAYE